LGLKNSMRDVAAVAAMDSPGKRTGSPGAATQHSIIDGIRELFAESAAHRARRDIATICRA